MKIESLLIENFRGIQKVDVRALGNTIIIAGQNGSGKSCIYDAIRLLKSTYGGYQQNEWQQFFTEFQIQLQGTSRSFRNLFNDPNRDVQIEIVFRLRDQEKAYIGANAKILLEEVVWQLMFPDTPMVPNFSQVMFSAQYRERKPIVDQRVSVELPGLIAQLSQPDIAAKINIQIDGAVTITDSPLLRPIFSIYRPRQIGVIDFHGSQRHYGRELVQGINLSLEQLSQNQKQHVLYNYNNKYNNVKGEMAGSYIKELLAEKAGATAAADRQASLNQSLVELFEAFFPDKKFLGPRPTVDGSLTFPVRTSAGHEHDLDELSSGEKEILYGYLRIRSSAPRDSIILLDEPELHLNPRLIRGLPEFYRKHLGDALENQLWLVTHSDALIREAVGKPGFSIFHMLPCGSQEPNASQLRPLSVTADLDLVLTDLVGDLAAYRPGGKGLIFEGGGDSDFDKTFVSSLFSEELRGINLISGTNKTKVKALHEVLAKAYATGDLPTKFYAVTDRDSDDSPDESRAVSKFTWDVYHIENYLHDEQIIAETLNMLQLGAEYSPESVLTRLSSAARRSIQALLIHKMNSYANSRLLRCVDLGFPPTTLAIGTDLSAASLRSLERLKAVVENDLSMQKLSQVEDDMRAEMQRSFVEGTWKRVLPGRDILKQFVSAERISVGYEPFRNLIVGRMVEKKIKPEGMKIVIEQIVSDS